MKTDATLDRATGTVGLACAIGVAVILGIHPFGSTELYDDGQKFLEHVSPFWIVIHLVATPLLFGFALVLWRTARGMNNPMAATLATWASMIAVGGMAIGAIHLIANDTTTFFAFSDTFEAGAGSEATLVAADLLLRIHAASLVTWMVSFWFMVPAVLAAALWIERDRPMWLAAITGISALCQVIAIIMFFSAGQHTTASETGVFRVGVTLLIAVIAILAWELRRGAPVGQPAAATSEAAAA